MSTGILQLDIDFFHRCAKITLMRRIIVSALKGGTGKTTTTVNFGKALKRAGSRVGLLDVDAIAPTLHKALGLAEAPRWELDSGANKLYPFCLDGLYCLTLASHYGEDPAVLWDEATLIRAMREIIRDVVWPELDYLLLDSPPSSSGFMQALYDAVRDDVFGILLVFQPTNIAIADLYRTLDFIRIKKMPILGLIANMSYCISPSGEKFWPFISPKVELNAVCQEYSINLLGEVPLTPSQSRLDQEFDLMVQRLAKIKPLVLKPSTFKKLYRALAAQALKTVIRRL